MYELFLSQGFNKIFNQGEYAGRFQEFLCMISKSKNFKESKVVKKLIKEALPLVMQLYRDFVNQSNGCLSVENMYSVTKFLDEIIIFTPDNDLGVEVAKFFQKY